MALPERNLEGALRDRIVGTMQQWLRDAPRSKRTIDWEIYPFDVRDSLDENGDLMTMIEAFASDTAYEMLFVIHPDRRAMSAPALEVFVSRLNARLRGIPSLADLRAFDAHPESRSRPAAPFPGFQVLSHSLLKTAGSVQAFRR